MGKIGVLLVNLGTPEGPTAEHVKPYLKEFLMDPLVIDIAYPFRWFLVNQIILRTRPQLSAEAYKKIWTNKGSPLLTHTLELAKKVQLELGDRYHVEPAMRYGNPSIHSGLEKLSNEEKIMILPLYPQYSLAATQSSIDQCKREMKKLGMNQKVEFLPPFYEHSHFVEAYREVIHEKISENKPEQVIFSFHGVPERHVKKTDPDRSHCLASSTCCDQITEANKNCYRAQCFATARALAKGLGFKKDQYHVSFQSRLGRTPWIKPYTDFLYKELAAKGIKKIAVVCPSFVADCLETLEEVAIRGRDDFIKAGGTELNFVPSLNSQGSWVRGVAEMVKSASPL
jgi:protoporphyrin/coproporphyrin ferrochelatase